jgi:EAL domain-containing protein (putative c-di-GMP-specific phosphodiesterase class I)
MELHLQPIVSVSDYKSRSAEGLIRWRHPVAGMVPPDGFIPIAERDEAVIDQLTRWVIETAASHPKRLAVLGFPIRVCVNVSGMNLHSLDFPDRVAASLHSASVRPDVIGLEITETSAMRDPAATADILTRLRLKGFMLAIDDFGTGHSSLEALRRIPFSTVKIDKGFVTDIASSRSSLTILRAIIALAHDLGLACVAEGVESEAAAGLLAELGVDNLQGYFFSRPLPLARFATWIRRWNLALIGRPATGLDATAAWSGPREVKAD